MAHVLLLAHPDERYADAFLRTLKQYVPSHTFTLSAAQLVPLGGSVRKSLQSAFERIDLVLILFSAKAWDENWLEHPSEPDRIALTLAFAQGKPVQPILFPDGHLPDEAELPDELKELLDRRPFRLTTKERFLELVQALRATNDGNTTAPQPVQSVAAPAEAPSTPEPAQDNIRQFLTKAGITIRSLSEPQEHDETLDRLAQLMGLRYPNIRLVYQNIKRSLNNGDTFVVNLSGYGDRCVADSTQLCTELHRLAFLEHYEYRKAPHYRITARPSRNPIAYNFFTGGWLERFTRAHLSKMLVASNVPFNIAYNIQVVLPEERNFEFDILLSIGTSGRILWFETKTSDYQDRIHKYSVLARIMGLPPQQVYLVLLETPEQTCEALRRMHKMNVLNLDGLQTLTVPQLMGS
ncbi:MAG: hypothetical protein NZ571_00755 [Anaerolineae bacterium]|nr:hypothetical protein [Anaerolineae bacterium]